MGLESVLINKIFVIFVEVTSTNSGKHNPQCRSGIQEQYSGKI